MDFTPAESELEVARLARQVLSARSGDERAAADLDGALWKEMAQAGLLALAMPPELGGDGLGVLAVSAVLTETGRHAARIPALATLALGVLPVTRCAPARVQRELLAGVAGGDTILTAGLREQSDPMPTRPTALADPSSGTTTVSGVKLGVPYAAAARWILAPVSQPGGETAVAVIDADAAGVSCQRTHSSSGLPEYTVRLDRAPAPFLLTGSQVVAELYRLAVAGCCCVADGALTAALELTTSYIRSREQFGRPLATFQAVAQHIADVYITARSVHLATLSACWRLEAGLDAASDVDVAGFWLAEHGPAAMRTCHHLHGGVGMDVTYPLPRYSALMTDLVGSIGGAGYRLDLLSAREGA
jgi:3-oxo-4-pregnene-20-carboxyl-CoA dehydrogenase alpha subunit